MHEYINAIASVSMLVLVAIFFGVLGARIDGLKDRVTELEMHHDRKHRETRDQIRILFEERDRLNCDGNEITKRINELRAEDAKLARIISRVESQDVAFRTGQRAGSNRSLVMAIKLERDVNALRKQADRMELMGRESREFINMLKLSYESHAAWKAEQKGGG